MKTLFRSHGTPVGFLTLLLSALLSAPALGHCDDDTLRSTLDPMLTFNDGPSIPGDDGLVEVKTNDPKCPKILWYPPLGHFICMPPEIAKDPRPPRSERPPQSNTGPGRGSRR